jgi:hypothetical protein
MITIEFTPWNEFYAKKDTAQIHSWLESIGKAAETAFKSGASRQWPGGDAKGAPPGEWPMRRSGTLLGTIDIEVTSDSMTIGSGAISGRGFDYSGWLQSTGRKMSKEALEQGLKSGAHLTRWVVWSRL